jgi:DNA-binding NarL/FixJ family response regulator
MEATDKRYTIGYVDEESQFVDKFKKKLKDAFEIIVFDLTPDLTLDQLIQNIEEAELDCLIADFELNEAAIVQFNGDEIINQYKQKYPFFPVFIITSKEEDDVLDSVEDGDIVRVKDELDNKLPILIQRINNKIETYYKDIRDAENLIDELVRKKKHTPLTVEEEEKLLENYIFLDKIYPEQKVITDNLIQQLSVTRLDEFSKDARAILEELKKLQ